MKIFLSYGHDSNAPLIEKIKEYLSRDAEGNLKHEVWIDTSEIRNLNYIENAKDVFIILEEGSEMKEASKKRDRRRIEENKKTRTLHGAFQICNKQKVQ